MFCQHGEEVWVVTGNAGPAYLKYLSKDDLTKDELEAALLMLKLHGPFSIFNHNHVARLGPIVVATTLQRDRDSKDQLPPP
ncbi:hypothetical protein VI817_007180 [Penicillium citrinum]|nr:hypothetical protein VI817_007180 [Penicillium citrinum]